jgi:hypothetical protein
MSRCNRPEQQDQRAAFDHLRRRGVPGAFAFHCPNGARRSAAEARIFKSLGVVAGIPDLLIVHAGHLYCLELKSERGRLSPAQIQTHEQLQRAGAHVAVANGIDAALAQLTAWELLR